MVNKKVAPKKKIRVNSRLVMEKLKENRMKLQPLKIDADLNSIVVKIDSEKVFTVERLSAVSAVHKDKTNEIVNFLIQNSFLKKSESPGEEYEAFFILTLPVEKKEENEVKITKKKKENGNKHYNNKIKIR